MAKLNTKDDLMPSARLVRIERAQGTRRVNGRPHGLNWVPVWEVVVEFQGHDDAREFFHSLYEGGICDIGSKQEDA